jgi:O-antigen ligase
MSGEVKKVRPVNVYTPVHRQGSLVQLAAMLTMALALGLALQYRLTFLPQINRLVGIVLAGGYALAFTRKNLTIPTEILLFGGFLLWGIVTGAIVAIDRSLFTSIVQTLVQFWGLAWVIAGLAALRRDASVAFVPLIVCAVIIVGYGFISGDFAVAAGAESTSRASSIVSNPNEMGVYALLGVAGLLYYWKRAKRTILRVGIWGLIGMLTFGIVYSGSRKAFLVLIAFILLWLWFCYRREVFGKLRNFLLVVFLLGSLYFIANYALSSTVMGYRIQASINAGGLGDVRTGMYLEGWEFFRMNPIAGVGLGNFKAYSIYGSYSHSDFMEALSTTGIVGFLLYFAIYPIIWKRLTRLQKVSTDSEVHYHAELFKAFILVLLALAFTRINFESIITWEALAGIIGYTWALDRANKQTTGQITPRRSQVP